MKDLTKGSILKGILLFVIPLLLGNFFQMFYTTVDALIVGKTIGAVAVGVIGSTGSITSLIISSGQGVTTGMSLLIPVIFVLKTRKMFKGHLLSGFVFQLAFPLC